MGVAAGVLGVAQTPASSARTSLAPCIRPLTLCTYKERSNLIELVFEDA